MNKNTQDQNSGSHSTNLQAGGNININTGLSYEDAKQIANDVFKNNFLELKGEAKQIAEERANEILISYLDRLKQNNPSGLNSAKDPDIQYALFTAQRDYARQGKKELADLLVDILIQRTQAENDLKKIVLNEALQIAPKLTFKQINSLSLIFLILYSRNNTVNNVQTFASFVKRNILAFYPEISTENSDYQHIQYTGSATLGLITINFFNLLRQNYGGVLSKGFDLELIDKLEFSNSQKSKLFTKCLRNQEKYQINAINEEILTQIANEIKINDTDFTQLKKLHNDSLMSDNEIKNELITIDPNFAKLLEIWDNSWINRLQLTTIGIALAHANIKRKLGDNLDLSIWIK